MSGTGTGRTEVNALSLPCSVSETLRGFESQTLSAPGSRRPSASLAGSLRSNVGSGGGGGGAGLLTLGAPALDRGEGK